MKEPVSATVVVQIRAEIGAMSLDQLTRVGLEETQMSSAGELEFQLDTPSKRGITRLVRHAQLVTVTSWPFENSARVRNLESKSVSLDPITRIVLHQNPNTIEMAWPARNRPGFIVGAIASE